MSGNLNFLRPHTFVWRTPASAAGPLSGHSDLVKNLNKPGEGARRGSGDPPHQFDAEVGRVFGIYPDFEVEDEFERDRR
jgi:hypothetical protein